MQKKKNNYINMNAITKPLSIKLTLDGLTCCKIYLSYDISWKGLRNLKN